MSYMLIEQGNKCQAHMQLVEANNDAPQKKLHE